MGISVRDHCLIVGTVAEALLRRIRALVAHGVATLAGMHDVGKISPGFEAQHEPWTYLYPDLGPFIGCETDHAKISQWVVQQLLQDKKLFRWGVPVGGHHGKIKGAHVTEFILNGLIGDGPWNNYRLELARELIARFGPLPTQPPTPTGAELWWLAGLITVSDWIGSDKTFFQQDRTSTHEDREARAEAALDTLHWGKAAVKSNLSFRKLFSRRARKLQQTAFDQITWPGLYIIEALMGDGKTEPALAGAYTLISKGLASHVSLK